MTRKLYNRSELAKALGLRSITIKSWIKHFPAFLGDLSETKRFTEEDLAKFKTIHQLVKVRGFTVDGAKRELGRKENFFKEREQAVKQLTEVRELLKGLRDSI